MPSGSPTVPGLAHPLSVLRLETEKAAACTSQGGPDDEAPSNDVVVARESCTATDLHADGLALLATTHDHVPDPTVPALPPSA